MALENLKPNDKANRQKRRIGRGPGCHGKTAGRGHKGQKSRSGYKSRFGFEGGQMPLQRRLPKRGFTNIFRKEYSVVNVGDLERFEDGARIGPEELKNAGLVRKMRDGIKLLGNGEVTKSFTLVVHKASRQAKKKIEDAKGEVVLPS